MNRFRISINALAIIILTTAFATLAQAQATRTWVSGVGDDVNPCSRTAPCKTYAGAISKTAKDGEISTLDPGGFGAVTITKSITINGGGGGQGYGSILASGTTGVIVNITDPLDVRKSVRLDGLNINGSSTGIDGIRMLAGIALHVEDTIIDGFTDDGIEVALTSGVGKFYARNVSIRNCVGDGIVLSNTGAGGLVLGSMDTLEIAASGNGVNASNNSRAHIKNSQLATMNTNGSGVLVSVATGEANVDHCIITNSPDGVKNNGGTSRVSRSVVTGNTNGLNNVSGTLKRFNNNMIDGNTSNTVGVITAINEG